MILQKHSRVPAYLTFLVLVLVFSGLFWVHKTADLIRGAVASRVETIERLDMIEVQVLAYGTQADETGGEITYRAAGASRPCTNITYREDLR